MSKDDLLPYHRTDYGDGDYDLLVGPGGFECLLTEPEDRTWLRDGADVVRELNRLHAAIRDARAQGWREALEEAIPAVSPATPPGLCGCLKDWGHCHHTGRHDAAENLRALAARGPKEEK